MGRVAVEMSMSLDGFVAGVNTDATNPLGENGELLHRWLFADPIDPADAQVAAEMRSSVGAVVVGRRTFDVGVDIWQDVPYPVPTFVLTHRQHEDMVMPSGTFTFVTSGVVDAVAAARAAAGERKVFLMGGTAAQQALAAGVVDEVQVNLVPVLLGRGVRMFDGLGGYPIELVQARSIGSGAATHVRYLLPPRGGTQG